MAADCTPGLGPTDSDGRRRPPSAWSRDTPPMRTFTIEPRGPFDLATARDFAGGFAAGISPRAAVEGSILMMLPVAGWAASAVVQVRQNGDRTIHGDVFGDGD